MKKVSPWSIPSDPNILFPLGDYENLIKNLGWSDFNAWLVHWEKIGGIKLASNAWPSNIKSDWIWGLGLPLLTDLEQHFLSAQKKIIYGISGLPGCGKTSLGKWLEAAATELNWPLTVVSLDDFYFPAKELEKAMAGNPWNVPRALPGSHSIELIEQSIENWKVNGELITPLFDKALRNGRGNRIGWRRSIPKVLIIEGWFLGCKKIKDSAQMRKNKNEILERMTEEEILYRSLVEESLLDYEKIWSLCNRIWHIKANNFNYCEKWKREQEQKMLFARGNALEGKDLNSFIRMIRTSIPRKSFQTIDANVIARLDIKRRITWIGNKEDEPSSINS